jgi:hypothetical protein
LERWQIAAAVHQSQRRHRNGFRIVATAGVLLAVAPFLPLTSLVGKNYSAFEIRAMPTVCTAFDACIPDSRFTFGAGLVTWVCFSMAALFLFLAAIELMRGRPTKRSNNLAAAILILCILIGLSCNQLFGALINSLPYAFGLTALGTIIGIVGLGTALSGNTVSPAGRSDGSE